MNKLNHIDKAGGRGWNRANFRNRVAMMVNIRFSGFNYLTASEVPNCSPSLALLERYLPIERFN